MIQLDPIAALATAPGIGAIAVIRVSGQDAISITNRFFRGRDLTRQASHTAHFGTLRNRPDASGEETIIDEVLVTIFRAPRSFTKEDVVEISCHGSEFIIQQILRRLTEEGVRLARPGEFTQRAFLNGQFDLVQAEAVADLIASDSDASHRAALTQLRGGFSRQLKTLRQQLIDFVALVELELDFGEEDVEFAHRDQLRQLMLDIRRVLHPLIESFSTGNAIKNGVPTVIVGKPNAGKSTLLNALLNEEKAIVSDIPGTTRDVIEDELFIDGIRFRLIDTAGLRQATDTIEAIGIERTQQKMRDASLVIYLFDGLNIAPTDLRDAVAEVRTSGKPYLLIGNKLDAIDAGRKEELEGIASEPIVWISAARHTHLDELKAALSARVRTDAAVQTGSAVVTNARHYEHLTGTDNALARAITGLDTGVTPDWLAMDLRVALQHLGELTGEITTDDLLDSIFSKFCIGK
ncbi:tRNA uridine-5-carboxymethylaminomethyl(34) synthesis GTPase MnmE [Spirosoma sordidisoli]|uniref:tRNA modification GTPase MnmE n=1 Tax=Spirosoma sordidisoli TaxID=2502893 RepID=A0A4Q2UKW5_9BACT|nr:tRNA uridine-5-carboxymethylaminomethyl(34) synthesis GTPase MnmE [Spirosoma sordidisoli]RYC68120.1 tRNA uridine-5-carboxymethylaminomethyl(34) synthesis GTPase MnmE [Spirosoma sordidisoli]